MVLEEKISQAANFTPSNDHVWSTPEPLSTEHLRPVPPLPPALIPEALRPWILDEAERMQVAPDGIAIAVLTVISSVIGSACRIRPKRLDNWTVCPNLWGMLIDKPGRKKSPILSTGTRRLASLESKAHQKYEEDHARYEADELAYAAQHSAIREQMKSAAKPRSSHGKQNHTAVATIESLKEDFAKVVKPEKPHQRRYTTQSATIEKLHEVLAANGRGILFSTDELMRLFATWKKSGHESDRAFFLESWEGGRTFTVDTISRGTLHCRSLTLSILGTTQPDKLKDLLSHMASDGENDGMLQRFQLAVYPDPLSEFEWIDREADMEHMLRAQHIVERLADIDYRELGADWDATGQYTYFRYSDEGYEIFKTWLTELEIQLRESVENPLILEHLSKYRSLMPSLSVIFHIIRAVGSVQYEPCSISKEDAEQAAAWCGFLEEHARRIYGLVGSATVHASRALLDRLRAGKVTNGFNARDVYRRHWEHLETTELVKHAIAELTEKGYLRPEVSETGGAPSVTYLINPKALIEVKVHE